MIAGLMSVHSLTVLFCLFGRCQWDLSTRRSVLSLPAHPGHPILAVTTLRDGGLLTQGKDGTVKLWDLNAVSSGSIGAAAPTPVRTIETHSYSFCKMQLCEETGSPLLLLPCEEASNFHLVDLRAPASAPPAQLIECESRVPRDENLEEQFLSRMDEKEAREFEELIASRPPQYERKVGMCMASKFFKPDNSATNAAAAGEQPCFRFLIFIFFLALFSAGSVRCLGDGRGSLWCVGHSSSEAFVATQFTQGD